MRNSSKYITRHRRIEKPVVWHVHIGAHKTGTTHFQLLLALHKNELNRRGVGVLLPKLLREKRLRTKPPKLCKMLPLSGLYTYQKRLELEFLAEPFDETIISEENFIGSPSDILAETVYPNLEKRLTLLLKMIPNNPKIYLSIRNQAEWLPSAYVQRLRHDPVRGGFQKIKAQILKNPPSWKNLIQRISSICCHSQIYLWTLEDYKKDPNAIMSKLPGCNFPCGPMVSIPKNTKTPSWEAIREIENIFNKTSLRKYRSEVNSIIETDNGGTKYAPFSEPEYKALADQYESDLEHIQSVARYRFLL